MTTWVVDGDGRVAATSNEIPESKIAVDDDDDRRRRRRRGQSFETIVPGGAPIDQRSESVVVASRRADSLAATDVEPEEERETVAVIAAATAVAAIAAATKMMEDEVADNLPPPDYEASPSTSSSSSSPPAPTIKSPIRRRKRLGKKGVGRGGGGGGSSNGGGGGGGENEPVDAGSDGRKRRPFASAPADPSSSNEVFEVPAAIGAASFGFPFLPQDVEAAAAEAGSVAAAPVPLATMASDAGSEFGFRFAPGGGGIGGAMPWYIRLWVLSLTRAHIVQARLIEAASRGGRPLRFVVEWAMRSPVTQFAVHVVTRYVQWCVAWLSSETNWVEVWASIAGLSAGIPMTVYRGVREFYRGLASVRWLYGAALAASLVFFCVFDQLVPPDLAVPGGKYDPAYWIVRYSRLHAAADAVWYASLGVTLFAWFPVYAPVVTVWCALWSTRAIAAWCGGWLWFYGGALFTLARAGFGTLFDTVLPEMYRVGELFAVHVVARLFQFFFLLPLTLLAAFKAVIIVCAAVLAAIPSAMWLVGTRAIGLGYAVASAAVAKLGALTWLLGGDSGVGDTGT